MPIVTSAAAPIIARPGVHIVESYADALDSRMESVKRRVLTMPSEGLKYWNQTATNKLTEYRSWMEAGATVPEARDVDGIPQMMLTPGFALQMTPVEYKLGISIGRLLLETDQFGVIDRHMADLNQAWMDTAELYAALPFNQTFSTTSFYCADKKKLCDTARPRELKTAGVWANARTAATLSQASIADMRLTFRQNRDGTGFLRPINMAKLVVPAGLEDTTIVQLGSEAKPGYNINDLNYLTRYGITYEVWNFLTSTTAYFGFGPMGEGHELYWLWGSRPDTIAYDNGNPDVRSYRLYVRFVQGAGKPFNVMGNAGA